MEPDAQLPPWSVRDRLRDVAPARARRTVATSREVWADLRLRLLVGVGHLPSHALRNAVYRSTGLVLHPTSSIHWRAEFYAPENIVIGPNCVIGDTAFLDGRQGIRIGRNVNIGSHVSIYTRQHDVDDPDFAEVGAPVLVADRSWVASHAIVLPGVTVGEGAVVAAGAVVARDVPPYTVVAGNPARPVRERSRDLRYTLRYAKRFV